MKVFFTDSFDGHYSVGAARFLCVAPDLDTAKALLHKTLYDDGLKLQYNTAVEGLKEVVTNVGEPEVINFGNGDY
jgi:hypothetical protein